MGSARTFWCRWRRRLKVCFSPASRLSGWPECFFVIGLLLVWRLHSVLRAGVLSFASPKESSQRRDSSLAQLKGDPRVGARYAGSLRYSKPAGAAELGPAGLRQSSPFIRRFLRCSAPLMGTRKASRNEGSTQEEAMVFNGQLKMLKVVFAGSTKTLYLFPWEVPSNAEAPGAFGWRCLSRRRV